MGGYALIIPELLLLVVAAWAMFAERLPGGDKGAAAVGAVLAAGSALAAMLLPATALTLFDGILVFDGTARFARAAIAIVFCLWLAWTASRGTGRVREAVALSAFASIGAMVMCEVRELVTFVLAVELATLPAYVLIGYRRERASGLEGALKYFLLSMLTTLVMLYGMSFLYGLTGTTRYAELDLSGVGALGILGVLLTAVGLFAKLSAAPFHYWAPDAYEGAEPWIVAYVSTIPKIAGAVAVVRLITALAPSVPSVGTALVAVAGASMLLGNLAALTQTDIRRLMAYSGVAHVGYLLLGAGALSAEGFGAAVFYAVAYSIPSLGIMLLAAEEGPKLHHLAGLSVRRPAIAWSAVIMLASLIGIPPLVGFFGKFYLFAAALDAGLGGWVVLAVAMSVVSAGYYLRIVRAMFFAEESSGEPMAVELAEEKPVASEGRFVAEAVIVAAALLVVVLGVAAGPLLTALGTPLP